MCPLLVTCLLFSGCRSGGANADVDGPSSARPTLPDLPLTSLMLRTDSQEQARARLVDEATRSCMADLGFDFPERDYSTIRSSFSEDRPFGVVDEAEAQRRGYHGYAAPAADIVGDFVASMTSGQQSEWRSAYAGAEGTGGGCLQQSLDSVYGDFRQYDQARLALEALVNEATMEATADGRVGSAVDRWSQCMNEGGFNYETPADAVEGGYAASNYSETPSDAEVKQALVDVACKHSVDLMTVWYDVKAQYERALVDENLELVARVRNFRSREVGEGGVAISNEP